MAAPLKAANCGRKFIDSLLLPVIFSKKGVRHIFTSGCRLCEGTTSQQQNGSNETNDKDRLFHASMQFVPQHGWSRQTLTAGAQSIGLPGIAHGLFPRGGVDLVLYFYADCNSRLVKYMANEGSKDEKEKISDFIRGSLQTRLSMLIPYVDQWPQAMSLLVLPPNAPKALNLLSQLVDDVWYHAGDRSADFNWYTKRISLAAVYKGTELYLLQDKSPEYTDTWQFMDRRFNDVKVLGDAMRQTQQTCVLYLIHPWDYINWGGMY